MKSHRIFTKTWFRVGSISLVLGAALLAMLLFNLPASAYPPEPTPQADAWGDEPEPTATPTLAVEPGHVFLDTSDIVWNSPVEIASSANGWTTIMYEDFNGTFPTSGWTLGESGDGDYKWAKRDCKSLLGGNYSAWAVGGGANGSSLQCGSYYPNNAYSYMIYGPFDLSSATDAELLFYYWTLTESGYDYLLWSASTNGSNFYGYPASGDSGGWQYVNFDLTSVPTLGNVTGQSQVWIGFFFISDSAIRYPEGVYVDDITLRASIGPAPTPTPTPTTTPSVTPIWKEGGWIDYAPSGMPDFDQRQDLWDNPKGSGVWSYSGPLAVANCLWWFDSKMEPYPVSPPTINDNYPLVTAYGAWDDHDPSNLIPFVDDLAWRMDTDGQRTGIPHLGASVFDMHDAINQYLLDRGLAENYEVTLMPRPSLEWVEYEVERCEDVILLMGFWTPQQGTGTTERVSVASDGTQGNSESVWSSISADGRYVAFHSHASNLVSGDTNSAGDIFVHDRQTGQTTRISVASDGSQGNGDSGYPSISADGRYVAFHSDASNLVSGDTNGERDIFVHDRQTGQTTRVSVASDGTQGNSESVWSSISADGRYVAFDSYATNLVSGDTNSAGDIFVHDRQTGQTTRVSVASDGTQGNDGRSGYPSISADGRYVAFYSYATNLVSGDTNSAGDIFVHDQQTGQTTRVSVASDGSQGNGDSGYLSISADGRYVAFFSEAGNLVSGDTNSAADIFVHDRQTGETTRVSVASEGTQGNGDSIWPSISADGRYVAFYSYATNLVSGDTNSAGDIFVHDQQTGQTTRVSLASDGSQGNGRSVGSSISADGRYVAFVSEAGNLVSGDTNSAGDIFLHDRQTGETTRVSVASEGTQGNGDSNWPSISADGRYVAFTSDASNLVSGDTNGYYDVFVHERGGGGDWVRLGGHYVTMAGVDSRNDLVFFSDPINDRAEEGWPGRVLNGTLISHVPIPGHAFSVHNDAGNVSHDIYYAVSTDSPGGIWGLADYATSYQQIKSFFNQNFPRDFPQEFRPKKELRAYAGAEIQTEVEYAIAISPIESPPFPFHIFLPLIMKNYP